jgi:hypothetical protein
MNHSFLRTALSATAFVTGALANTFELPDEKPIAAVTIPSTWKLEKYADGVECVSPKNEVYLAVEAIESDSLEESVTDAVKFLKKKGVSIKKETAKRTPMKINDLEGAEVLWQGSDEDGDCVVNLSYLQVTKKRGLMVLYWSATALARKNDADFGEIMRSIKRLEK